MLNINQKIRVLRKICRKINQEEIECHYYSGLMGPYPAESVASMYDDKRKKIIDKLGLTEEQIKTTMNEFSKKEWEFIPCEAQCFGVVPKAFEDLSRCVEVNTAY